MTKPPQLTRPSSRKLVRKPAQKSRRVGRCNERGGRSKGGGGGVAGVSAGHSAGVAEAADLWGGAGRGRWGGRGAGALLIR